MNVIGLQNVPASGPAILVANHVSPYDRQRLREAIARTIHFEDWRENLNGGELVAVFPEGAPSRTGSIESFGPEVETLIAENPSAGVIPAAFCSTRPDLEPVLYIGPLLKGKWTAGELRQRVVELACEGIQYCRSAECTLIYGFVETARTKWDEPSIADAGHQPLSFGEVFSQALGLSRWIRDNTGASEQNIGLYLPAGIAAAIANYAVTLAGKVAVNLNFAAGETVCRQAADQCGLRTILSSRAFLQKISQAPWTKMICLEDIRTPAVDGEKAGLLDAALSLAESVRSDSTACIIFSSGSTGVPKGVELTHWNIVANADGLVAKLPPGADDCMLGVLPFFHSFGYTFALWFPVLAGMRAVYHASPTDAKTIGDLAEMHRATYFASTPTFCAQYARKVPAHQFASLKYILVGAEKLRDSVANEFRAHFGIDLLAGYGCTELGPGVAINVPDVESDGTVHIGTRSGSVGRPLPGISIRIVDPETYAPLPNGRQGLVLVNGPSRMPGYLGQPELTAKVLHDGYYETGDLGYVDDDGFLYITDRLARFSKVAGEMAPHLPIEEAVSDLTPAFVTGIPDTRRGERLMMLYTNPQVTPADLSRRLDDSGLPALWIPKRESIRFVDSIPILPSGKVNLKEARELAIALAPVAIRS